MTDEVEEKDRKNGTKWQFGSYILQKIL
jgi:hypothetical protein